MRKSIAIATAMVVGGGAAAAGAGTLQVPLKWYGSDTLQTVTWDALGAAASLAVPIPGDPNIQSGQVGQYLAGGSGAGQGAMANGNFQNAAQQAAPMSKMMTSGACGTASTAVFGINNGTDAVNASGIVIGMDAVSIFSSVASGSASACTTNGVGSNADTKTTDGLWAANGTNAPTGVFNASTATQNWKWVLALLYGGLDLSNGPGSLTNEINCSSQARINLVSNWSNLFQNSCANGTAICGTTVDGSGHQTGFGNALGHAFRRDDGSGTSDVFSSLLGLQVLMPSPSSSSNNGFGASPFCNAMNWDTNTVTNTTACNNPPHDQFVGPGGVIDSASAYTFTDFKNGIKVAEANPGAGSGNHHRPPPGTWGDNPISTTFTGSDVLPTSFQDNDPLRRTCLGSTAGFFGNSGEEVCNLDGKLGVVLAIPSSDWIPASGAIQYPTTACTTFLVGKPARSFKCAPGGNSFQNAECPNGDVDVANGCLTPVDGANQTAQCLNNKSKSATLINRALGSYDGRRHNLAMYTGFTGQPAFLADAIQNGKATPPTVDFFGGIGRIHSVQSVFDAVGTGGIPPNTGCQLADATEQIACLTQADPCSVGYAGDGGKTWVQHANGNVCATFVNNGVCAGSGTGGLQPPYTNGSSGTCPAACVAQGTTGSPTIVADSIRIDGSYPSVDNVQALGTQHVEYQVSRKLYYNSLIGFGNMQATTNDPNGYAGELDIGKWESVPANINPILASIGYFALSPAQAPNSTTGGATNPFCEDFNETMVCNDGTTSENLGTAGAGGNACAGNPSGIPSETATGWNYVTTVGTSTSTVCGNGIKEAYEECDDGTPGQASATTGTIATNGAAPGSAAGNGASGNNCSNICRCAGITSYQTTDGTHWGCQ